MKRKRWGGQPRGDALGAMPRRRTDLERSTTGSPLSQAGGHRSGAAASHLPMASVFSVK